VQPGTDPLHAKAFAARMREVGIEHRRFTSGQLWVGIRMLAKRKKPTRREPSVESLTSLAERVIDLSDLSSWVELVNRVSCPIHYHSDR
jgi:hypothetical protein